MLLPALYWVSANFKLSGMAMALPGSILIVTMFCHLAHAESIVSINGLVCAATAFVFCYLQSSRRLTLTSKSATPMDVLEDTCSAGDRHAGADRHEETLDVGFGCHCGIADQAALLSYAGNIDEIRVLSGPR